MTRVRNTARLYYTKMMPKKCRPKNAQGKPDAKQNHSGTQQIGQDSGLAI